MEITYEDFKKYEHMLNKRGMAMPVWGSEGSFERKKAVAFIRGIKKGMEGT